jgi:hypothetical protein
VRESGSAFRSKMAMLYNLGTEHDMPHLTPTLPPRYRRLALAALDGLMTRAKADVTGHRATVERLTAAGQETGTARAGLGLAERCLALLRGRRGFLRSDEPPPDEG